MDNDYTPTTEVVRDFYQFGRHENGDRQGQGSREAEFDRWLAAHDKQLLAPIRQWAEEHYDPEAHEGADTSQLIELLDEIEQGG